jgi:hypothetical protein
MRGVSSMSLAIIEELSRNMSVIPEIITSLSF